MSESLREKIARARYEAWRKRMREEHDLHYCSFDDLDARGADGRAGEIADVAAILAAVEAAGYAIAPQFATARMIHAGRKAMFGRLDAGEAESIWRAMVLSLAGEKE